jgi:hypothetical protein
MSLRHTAGQATSVRLNKMGRTARILLQMKFSLYLTSLGFFASLVNFELRLNSAVASFSDRQNSIKEFRAC